MARPRKQQEKGSGNGANVGYEAELWKMADALRGSMDAAEYKHVVLGLTARFHVARRGAGLQHAAARTVRSVSSMTFFYLQPVH